MGRKTQSEILQHFHLGIVISTRFPKEWSGREGLPEDWLWQSPSSLLKEAVWVHTQDWTDSGSVTWPETIPDPTSFRHPLVWFEATSSILCCVPHQTALRTHHSQNTTQAMTYQHPSVTMVIVLNGYIYVLLYWIINQVCATQLRWSLPSVLYAHITVMTYYKHPQLFHLAKWSNLECNQVSNHWDAFSPCKQPLRCCWHSSKAVPFTMAESVLITSRFIPEHKHEYRYRNDKLHSQLCIPFQSIFYHALLTEFFILQELSDACLFYIYPKLNQKLCFNSLRRILGWSINWWMRNKRLKAIPWNPSPKICLKTVLHYRPLL